ncbi:MAG: hypothetical protein HY275_18230 [Gemmatimonadetes bacterium]|nr:hypothetical protein [Gemmatimonadota bacterium]
MRLPTRSPSFVRCLAAACALLAGIAVPLHAQQRDVADLPELRRIELSGPRFGMTLLSDATLSDLRSHGLRVAPVISQFGWQFERAFANPGSMTALSEWVLLVGGMDQGALLPSLSWVVGLRGSSGFEFGVGPNASLAGVSLVVAGGYAQRVGGLLIPVNLSVVPSRDGMRFSLLTGFAMR